jgi:MFS family permease
MDNDLDGQDKSPPHTTSKHSKWRTLGSGGGLFLVVGAAENGIWPILLPTIANDFASETSWVVWILVAFALGMAGTALTAGRVSDLIGHRRVAIAGLSTEIVILGLIVVMPSIWPVLGLRFIQGIARAADLNSMAALLVGGYPREQRGQIIGIRAGLSALGAMLGPVYAGVVAQQFDWRFVPIGIAAFYGVQLVLLLTLAKRDTLAGGETWDHMRHLEWVGAFAFLFAMSSLLLSARLFRGGGDWGTGLALIALAAILFWAAIRFERRSANPVLNLALFKSPAFSGAGAALIIFALASGASHFLFPFFTQRGLGWSLSLSGSVMVSFYVIQMWASPLMGHLSDKVGTLRIQLVGIGILVTGLLLGSQLGEDASPQQVILVLLVMGGASSLFMPPNSKVIYNAVPPSELAGASSISVAGRYVGQSLGAALAASILLTQGDEGIIAAFRTSMLTLAAIVGAGASTALLVPALIRAQRREAQQ